MKNINIILIFLFSLIAINCPPGNLCKKHKDCPECDLCFVDSSQGDKDDGWCIGALEGKLDIENNGKKILIDIRKCKKDSDCEDCSEDKNDNWGCLDKGGEIHICMLKIDGEYQDPIIDKLRKECPK